MYNSDLDEKHAEGRIHAKTCHDVISSVVIVATYGLELDIIQVTSWPLYIF